MTHKCNPLGQWSHCVICDGRIHLAGCTTRPNKHKDCCPARHKMLYDSGHARGLNDSSFLMWTLAHPMGVHQPED